MLKHLLPGLLLALALAWGPPPAAAQASRELSPAQPGPAAPSAASSNYVLKSADEIEVRVFRNPELDGIRRLSRDGTINFPLLGIVPLAGQTTYEAAAKLAALLDKDYLVRPQVFVTVVSTAKKHFNVLGQVATPGLKELPPEGEMDLLGAIAASGGFTRLANQSDITVRRTSEGRDETLKVDAKRLSFDRNAKPFVIKANDTIVVKERLF